MGNPERDWNKLVQLPLDYRDWNHIKVLPEPVDTGHDEDDDEYWDEEEEEEWDEEEEEGGEWDEEVEEEWDEDEYEDVEEEDDSNNTKKPHGKENAKSDNIVSAVNGDTNTNAAIAI